MEDLIIVTVKFQFYINVGLLEYCAVLSLH